ncbi:MAG: UDP-4-amino-4,6-dideoxy-N-acetyl-beta-L-altrosamine transaminase [Gammaproteobacteria bacterium]|mgnify:CR=1 FL=1|nr:MAG: UDP-4-amino-4,6-dideoxy-N-acetyl-beta-L-altrosamine transaminase [Gammaproteobacteria bacterium]
MIPYGRQEITQDDINAVIEVLNSDFLTQGPALPAFENAVAKYCSASFAVTANSATSALHLACLALGIGKNDYVWTSPITFVASANAALYCGAHVDFIDINPITYNICVKQLEKKLTLAQKENKLPKAVIPVHLCGQSCEMDQIHALSKRFGFKIIEDASHAIGGKYKNDPIGSCKYSDISIFSFHPVKIVTTAEGGMALTNNSDYANKMKLLRSHGITRNPDQMTHQPHGPWYYQQIDLGFNYRMTDIQAALGLSQLNRLDDYVRRRNELATRYDQILQSMPVIVPFQSPDNYSARHLYVIRLKLDQIQRTHLQVFEALREKGIGVNVHYIPVHTQPYYAQLEYQFNDCPEAERYYSEAISLPLYPTMSEKQQDLVAKALKETIEE